MATVSVSIVTPSFNQRPFIERCLESVASQTTLPVEHIVLDPGSSDGTREVLKNYAARHPFARLVLEPDKGQADAINRGFRQSTGDVVTWLNTDDWYAGPDVLADVAQVFASHPGIDVVHGRGAFVDGAGSLLREAFANATEKQLRNRFVNVVGILQPTVFFRRQLLDRVGLLNTDFNCAFDYELWVRFVMSGARFHFLDKPIARATFHEAAKSTSLRSQQLHESVRVTRLHYGFGSAEWVQRAVECDVAERNGIFDAKALDESSRPAIERLSQAVFNRYNGNKRAKKAILTAPQNQAYAKTRDLARKSGLLNLARVIVTTFDEAYLEQGLTLIASIHRHQPGDTVILVYDLALSDAVKEGLESLHNVFVVPYPKEDVQSYPDFLKPKNYGYKCSAIWDARRYVAPAGTVLWIDAGVSALKPLDAVWNVIERDGVFFVDHDDKTSWPFYNATFTHPLALRRMSASREEMMGPHLCSCLLGYRMDGPFLELFETAARYARDREIVVHDKQLRDGQPDATGCIASPPRFAQLRRWAADPQLYRSAGDAEVKETFGYAGHRQDQSIFSVLAARYRVPLRSAREYCMSNPSSAEASRLNWESGSVSTDYEVAQRIPKEVSHSVTYHHRGTYFTLTGLRHEREEQTVLAIVDSTRTAAETWKKRLSVRDILWLDGGELKGVDARYLVCLSEDDSTAIAGRIQALLNARTERGPDILVLRGSVIACLSGSVSADKVIVDYDDLLAHCRFLSEAPPDSLTQATLIGALLGYPEVILLDQPGLGPDAWQELVRRLAIKKTVLSGPGKLDILLPPASQDSSVNSLLERARSALAGRTGFLNAENVVVLFFPTLRTNQERAFWTKFIDAIRERGYQPVVVSFLLMRSHLNLEGNYPLDCPRIFVPGVQAIARMQDFSGFVSKGLDVESEMLRGQTFTGALNALVQMQCATAIKKTPDFESEIRAADLAYAEYMHELLRRLSPVKVIVNNDTHPMQYVVRCCAEGLGIPVIHSERSPFVNQWFEEEGYYRKSGIGGFLEGRPWAQAGAHEEHGRRLVEMLMAAPAGHRASPEILEEVLLGKAAGVRPTRRGGARARIFLPMDHVLATGWAQPAHPLRPVNYPLYESPEAAVTHLAGVARRLGAELIVKPHPSEPINTRYIELVRSAEDITYFEGSIEEGLAQADVVVTFLTKVTYVGLAWQKAVVTLAPNTAALSGLTFHCENLDGVEDEIRRAFAFTPSPEFEAKVHRFLGYLDLNFFVSNELGNSGASRLLDSHFPEPALKQPVRKAFGPYLPITDPLAPDPVDSSHNVQQLIGLLFGPYARRRNRTIDEVAVVEEFFDRGLIDGDASRRIMLDVGACMGDSHKSFAAKGWTVHAFEPNPPMFEKLCRMKTAGVILNPLAVSNTTGEKVSFYTSKESIGISSMLPFRETHQPTAVVETIRLDEYCRTRGIGAVDLLKVDTEGYDLMVLKGADWNSLRPRAVVCEFEDAKTLKLDYRFADLAGFLSEKGYQVFVSEWHPVTRYGSGEHRWRAMHRWPCTLLSEQAWGNLIAFRDAVTEYDFLHAVRYEVNRKAVRFVSQPHPDVRQKGAGVAPNPDPLLIRVVKGFYRLVVSTKARGIAWVRNLLSHSKS